MNWHYALSLECLTNRGTKQPARMTIGGGDTLVVYDVALSRLSFFSPSFGFVRSVQLPSEVWMTDMVQLENSDLVIAAWDRSSSRTIHVLRSSDGALVRSFREVPSQQLQGFESSLLGGQLDVTPSGHLLYTQLAPYSLELYEPSGQRVWHCVDPSQRLTRPQEVVSAQGDRRMLQWNRFVHSGSVFALSDSLILNIVTDPINDRRQFDLVSRECELLSRTVLDVPMLLTKRDRSRTLFVGGLNLGTPEVVVYRLQLMR